MEGVVTAVVLGGFFAFVCLLVVYKTKCKPLWKNRKKRLTNTPVTASMADVEISHHGNIGNVQNSNNQSSPPGQGQQVSNMEDFDDYEFECIPLKSVFAAGGGNPGGRDEDGDGEEDDDFEVVDDFCDDDIYFLDEFGNYVFPVTEPPPGGVEGGGDGAGGGGGGGCGSVMVPPAGSRCSCHASDVEEVNWVSSALRRQSQVRHSIIYGIRRLRLIIIDPAMRKPIVLFQQSL
jgi:hypothetical protein